MPKIVDHAARRRSLVEASWDVIATEGIEGVTLRKVATAAGCTTGRLTHYFSNREELILSALRSVYAESAQRMLAIQEVETDAKKRLRRIAHEALPLDDIRLREWRVWIVFWAAATANDALARENAHRFNTWQQLLTKLITDITGRKQAKQRALEFASVIDGLGIRICLSGHHRTQTMAKAVVDEWLTKLT